MAIDGAGMPDGWHRLWAPHRLEYLRRENRPLADNQVTCPFCRIPTLTDEEGLIVFRGKSAFVVMNLYPYNPGHLLVCAYRHVADLTELTDAERNEIVELTATIPQCSCEAIFLPWRFDQTDAPSPYLLALAKRIA